nr:MAG TPA: hypothetical protein [Caudoviricetes sp.]
MPNCWESSSDNPEHLSSSFPMPDILLAFFLILQVTKSTFAA